MSTSTALRRRALAAACVPLLLVLVPMRAVHADGPSEPVEAASEQPAKPEALRLKSAAQCRTDGGSTLTLAPGDYIVPADAWRALDAELHRLQDADTHARAEVRVLREHVSSTRPIALGVAIGAALVAGGVYAYRKL